MARCYKCGANESAMFCVCGSCVEKEREVENKMKQYGIEGSAVIAAIERQIGKASDHYEQYMEVSYILHDEKALTIALKKADYYQQKKEILVEILASETQRLDREIEVFGAEMSAE